MVTPALYIFAFFLELCQHHVAASNHSQETEENKSSSGFTTGIAIFLFLLAIAVLGFINHYIIPKVYL